MSWTIPRTWVGGELVTASLMNAQVRDNLKSVPYVFATQAGGANSGSTETTIFTKTIDDSIMTTNNDTFVFDFFVKLANNSNSKAVKIYSGTHGGSLTAQVAVTLTNANVSGHYRVRIARTDSTGYIFGYYLIMDTDALYSAQSSATSTTWSTGLDVKLTLTGAASNDLVITESIAFIKYPAVA
jgi:hypothetical protein